VNLLAIAVLIVTAFTCDAVAQRNQLRPADFEPLTELPWEAPNSTLASVIDRIFREPNPIIRYPLLAEYLRMVPVKQLGEAFDRSISLEGTRPRTTLLNSFLEIWASRDPQSCWERTKQLFRVVGIEEGWLSYDDWSTRPADRSSELRAIQSSPFWLEARIADQFSPGSGEGQGAEDEACQNHEGIHRTLVRHLQDVARLSEAAGSIGELRGIQQRRPRDYQGAFPITAETRQFLMQGHYYYDAPRGGDCLRRSLTAEPASALELLKSAREIKWTLMDTGSGPPDGPSIELLLIWAKLDMPGLAKWAEARQQTRTAIT
jgi:hypothetical protein